MARVDEDRLGHTLDSDYADNCAPWKWWVVDRVEFDEDDVVTNICPIPVWMGEQVREYVRAADESAMEEFYGAIFSLHFDFSTDELATDI